ncbi:MAG: thioredoxin domain-containing protein [Gemmatimonadaceae bacterium]|nr:thioredoxin domain-containing protein [Gemmatimonadaceae bacterium]
MLGDLDLTGIGHDAGSVTAPVVLIDFSDYGCPYCGQFTRETYPVLEREYVRTGKVFFKYVPFIVGMFPHAIEATRAAECASDQGMFWAMADRVYEAQKEWKRGGDPRSLLVGIAGVVGADTVKFGQCYADRRTDARTARANDLAGTIGVRVTPSFVVNGRPVQGALPLAEFRKVIDAALLLARATR